MLKLIKGELFKIFHKKSTIITLFIIFLLVIFIQVIIMAKLFMGMKVILRN